MMRDCVHMVKSEYPDTIGGFTHDWKPGGSFKAAIVKNASPNVKTAEKDEVAEAYTITTNEPLSFHDVFRRVEDGAVFRVTTNDIDSKPPDEATFTFVQVQAERWELA